ncbi:HNH endonuclease signature motif containing protein [Mycobacterium sp.]|uniref:HNH endonuclease signature motif containing protein n=1 Tax=Mycobacterium sp. TaxID=1785 RepID=UPI0039C9F66B
MSPRAPKICSSRGCTALVRDGGSRCPEHRPAPFGGQRSESSRRTGTRAFTRIRRRVFERDGNLCRAQLDGCTTIAAECHHLDRVVDGGGEDDLGRLIAVCTSCHRKLTAAQAKNTSTGAPSAPRPVRRRHRDAATPSALPRTINASL